MKFIIDTDPGTDDAVAILIALAHFTDEELLAITTVGGNVGVDVGEMLLEFSNMPKETVSQSTKGSRSP